MQTGRPILALCDVIRETSFAIHRYLRHGHFEKIYENALVHRLSKKGIHVEPQFPIDVREEDGTPLGEFFADLFVEDVLLVELKACKTLSDEHLGQLFGYLRATGIEHGLLVNFGAPKLQVRKLVLDQLS